MNRRSPQPRRNGDAPERRPPLGSTGGGPRTEWAISCARRAVVRAERLCVGCRKHQRDKECSVQSTVTFPRRAASLQHLGGAAVRQFLCSEEVAAQPRTVRWYVTSPTHFRCGSLVYSSTVCCPTPSGASMTIQTSPTDLLVPDPGTCFPFGVEKMLPAG